MDIGIYGSPGQDSFTLPIFYFIFLSDALARKDIWNPKDYTSKHGEQENTLGFILIKISPILRDLLFTLKKAVSYVNV